MRTLRILATLVIAACLASAALGIAGASSGWFGRGATALEAAVVDAQWSAARDYLEALDAIAGEACDMADPATDPGSVRERFGRVQAILDRVVEDLASTGVSRPADIPATAPSLEDRVLAVCPAR